VPRSAERGDHALGDVAQIGGAFGHVAAHADEHLLEGGEGLEDRALARRAVGDALLDVVGQRGVDRHEGLGVEDVLRLSAGLLTAGRQIIRDRAERQRHPSELGVRLGGALLRARLGEGIRHPQDRADGHSASDANAL
jgi:hypothetical protein